MGRECSTSVACIAPSAQHPFLRAWRAGTAPASPELGEVAVDEFAPGQGDRR